MNKIRIGRTAFSLAACTAAMAYGAAQGQNQAQGQSATAAPAAGLQEVVVTAERRKSTAQKTAASISVRTGQALQKSGQYSLAQILQDVPGITAAPSNGNVNDGSDTVGTGLTIRGVIYNAGAGGLQIVSQVPTTAVYTDGVYEGAGSAYDIARVEVLRGPQGTLYGRSATAGVVATYTNDPVLGKLGGDETIELGNYGVLHYTGALNVPVGDELALRISGNHYERRGYYSASGGALSNNDYRAKLLYKPSEDFSALLATAGDYNVAHSGGSSGSLTSPNTVIYSPLSVGTTHDHFRQYWANIEWNLGPVTLTYLPAVRSWNQSATVYAANGPITFGQAEHTPYDQFLTQELRLASNGNSRVTWQAGFFGYDNQIKDTNLIALSDGALVADVVAKRATQDAGLFGEATYHIRDDWRLTAGLRLDYTGVSTDESYTSNLNLGVFGPEGFSLPTVPVTATLSGDAGSRDYRNITYRARLEHDLTPVNLLYAQVSTGYLPGNVEVGTISSPRGNVPVPLSFSEENLTAWEIGSKNRFLGNTLQLDGDVYFNDYRGYQDTLQTGASDNPTFVVLGIPARMIGTELEAEYRPTAKDNLGMTLGYIDTKFYNVPALYAEYVAQRQILGISPFTLSASYEHDFNLADGSTLSVKSDADYFSSFDSGALTPATAAAGKDAYVRVNSQILGNLSVTWASASGRYSVSGYIRNLADNRYKNTGGISLNYTATGEAQYSTTGRQYDPRTVGILEHIAF